MTKTRARRSGWLREESLRLTYAMVTKPLYHGAINIHGAAPSPDNKLLACTGRGTSNVYLIDLETMKVIGNTPNPQANEQTNAERITSGVMVGREPRTDL